MLKYIAVEERSLVRGRRRENIVRLARTEFDARQRDRRICTGLSTRTFLETLLHFWSSPHTRWMSKWIKGTQENSRMTEGKESEARWKLADSPIALSLSASSSFLSMPRWKNLSKVLQYATNKGNIERVWLMASNECEQNEE